MKQWLKKSVLRLWKCLPFDPATRMPYKVIRAILLVILFILSTTVFARMTTCPPVELVKRTPGQNGWNTLYPGWQGRFDAPLIGQGYSSEVARFSTVRWIKLNNLPDGPGKIECDYEGNFEGELIRFDQAGSFSTAKPVGDHWSCKVGADFPNSICECSMSVDYCPFDSDAKDPQSPMVSQDVRERLDAEFHK